MTDGHSEAAADLDGLDRGKRCWCCLADESDAVYESPDNAVRRCRLCRAEWLQRIPTWHDPAFHYTEPLTVPYLWHRARRFNRYLKSIRPGGGRIVDIGCGTGEFLWLARQAGWEVIGIEVSSDTARDTESKTGIRVDVKDLTAAEVPDLDYRADVVTLWGVLEHVADPLLLLERAAAALEPGGLLLFETPNAGGAFRRIGAALRIVSRGRFLRPYLETLGAGHVSWLARATVERLAIVRGWELVDLRGSRNSTRNLVSRFRDRPPMARVMYGAATALLNISAPILGMPNQLLGAFKAP